MAILLIDNYTDDHEQLQMLVKALLQVHHDIKDIDIVKARKTTKEAIIHILLNTKPYTHVYLSGSDGNLDKIFEKSCLEQHIYFINKTVIQHFLQSRSSKTKLVAICYGSQALLKEISGQDPVQKEICDQIICVQRHGEPFKVKCGHTRYFSFKKHPLIDVTIHGKSKDGSIQPVQAFRVKHKQMFGFAFHPESLPETIGLLNCNQSFKIKKKLKGGFRFWSLLSTGFLTTLLSSTPLPSRAKIDSIQVTQTAFPEEPIKLIQENPKTILILGEDVYSFRLEDIQKNFLKKYPDGIIVGDGKRNIKNAELQNIKYSLVPDSTVFVIAHGMPQPGNTEKLVLNLGDHRQSNLLKFTEFLHVTIGDTKTNLVLGSCFGGLAAEDVKKHLNGNFISFTTKQLSETADHTSTFFENLNSERVADCKGMQCLKMVDLISHNSFEYGNCRYKNCDCMLYTNPLSYYYDGTNMYDLKELTNNFLWRKEQGFTPQDKKEFKSKLESYGFSPEDSKKIMNEFLHPSQKSTCVQTHRAICKNKNGETGLCLQTGYEDDTHIEFADVSATLAAAAFIDNE